MLKFLFSILLLANAGLLAYRLGAFEALLGGNREPARIANQLNADKLRLIAPPAPKRAPEPVPASAPVSAPAAAPAAAPAPAAGAVAEKKPRTFACVEVGNFNAADARRFGAQLAALQLGERVSQRPLQEVSSHIVYIPPQPDRETAEKKAEQLRALGITDFFIIQDNPALRWAISLGVFKHEEAARTHLANLTQKGVRSARIAARSTNTGLVAFQLRDVVQEKKALLEDTLRGYPKQSLRDCPPA